MGCAEFDAERRAPGVARLGPLRIGAQEPIDHAGIVARCRQHLGALQLRPSAVVDAQRRVRNEAVHQVDQPFLAARGVDADAQDGQAIQLVPLRSLAGRHGVRPCQRLGDLVQPDVRPAEEEHVLGVKGRALALCLAILRDDVAVVGILTNAQLVLPQSDRACTQCMESAFELGCERRPVQQRG